MSRGFWVIFTGDFKRRDLNTTWANQYVGKNVGKMEDIMLQFGVL
jgi:hypothetical protein